MSNARDLADFAPVAPQITGKNLVINGGYDVWQRGTSQTTSGYGSDDRWANANSGSTKTASRQTFTLGQTDVPGNPKYYARTVVTTGSGSTDNVNKNQSIESVIRTAGQEITLSFYAKADSAKNIATEFFQSFGTGGSPSATTTALGVTTHSLTTSWQRFTVTATMPSISGKTLGTNNDDRLGLVFWFDAGSSFNARTNSLGNQSGTFDIANVQLEFGDTATDFEQRDIGTEKELCYRYYQHGFQEGTAATDGTGQFADGFFFFAETTSRHYKPFQFSRRMRAVPTVTLYNPRSGGAAGRLSNGTIDAGSAAIADSLRTTGFRVDSGATNINPTVWYCNWTADAEL